LIVNNSDDEKIFIIQKYNQVITDLGKLSAVSISDDGFPEGSALGVVDKLSIAIPLKGAINISDEINRLNKEIDKIQNEIEKFQKNLNNENFLNRAPRDIIDEIKNKLNINFDKKSKIQDAINRLKN